MSDKWPVKTLKEICSLITDGTHNSPKYVETGVPMLDSKHINSDFTIDDRRATKFISSETDSELSKRCKPQAGDVLVSSRGTIGKIAIVKSNQNFNIMGNMILLRTPEDMLERYLAYSLLSKLVEIQAISRGVAQKGLYLNQIRNFEVGYPEISEQKRIVAILDEAFSGIDTAIANTEKNLANARELFESYLNTVFTNQGDGWKEVALEEYIKFIDYRGKTPKKTESGLRLITAKNVRMGYLQREPEEFVSPDTYDSWMTRGIPKKDDVLFTTEAPLGLVCQLDTDEKVVFAQRIITMQAQREVIDPAYLSLVLRSALLQSRIHEKGTGATAKGIKASLLKQITIPLPEPKEQKMIVEKLQSLQVETKRLEVIYQQKLNSLKELKQSLLQKAFSGELTAEGDKLMDEAVA